MSQTPPLATPDYWEEACRHLARKDRVMKRLIPQFGNACLQGNCNVPIPAKSKEFNEYKQKFNCDTIVYSWDLAGMGTLQFPEKNVYGLAGFSEKVFDIMKLMEEDKSALISRINQIQL